MNLPKGMSISNLSTKLPKFDMSKLNVANLNLSSLTLFDFMLMNPLLIISVVVALFLVLLYSTSTYRLRRLYFFAYTSDLSPQIDHFVNGLATSIVHVLRFTHAVSPHHTQLQKYAYSTDNDILLKDTFDTLFQLTRNLMMIESDEQFQKDLNEDITDNSMLVKNLQNRLKTVFRYTTDDDDKDDHNYFYTMHVLKYLLLVYCNFEHTFDKKDKMETYLKNHTFISDFNYSFDIKKTPTETDGMSQKIIELLAKVSPSHDSKLDLNTLLSPTSSNNLQNQIDSDKSITNYLDTFDKPYNSEHIPQVYFDNLTKILKEHDVDVETLVNTDYDVVSMQSDIYFKSGSKVLQSVQACIHHISKEETSDESSGAVANSLSSVNFDIVKEYFERDALITQLLKEQTLQSLIESITDDSNLLRTITDSHFKLHKTNLHHLHSSFEAVLYKFQSMSGSGLLMMKFIAVDSSKYEIVTIMNNFNKLMTLHDVDQNRSLVAKAWSLYTNTDLDTSEKNKILARTSQFYTALANIQLHISVEFPRLLYYDTRRNPDKDRLRQYYQQLLDQQYDYFDTILTKVIPDIPIKPFSERDITLHKPLKSVVINALIEYIIQPFRTFLREIWESYQKDFGQVVEWVFSIENYTNYEPKENYTNYESETDYINEDGDLIEPIFKAFKFASGGGGGLFKPLTGILKKVFDSAFGPVFKVVEFTLICIDYLTNPRKFLNLLTLILKILIKIPIAIAFSVVLVLEGILLIPSGLLVMGITLLGAIHFIMWTFGLIFLITVMKVVDVSYTDGFFMVVLYKWILATENDINQWKHIPSYEIGNEVNRPQVVSACAPCTENYVPGDLFCERIPEYVPRYSPHANVNKILEGRTITGLTEPGELEMDVKFIMLPRHERKRIIEKYTKDVMNYHKMSNSKMKPYDPMLKNICRNISTYDLNRSDRQRVEHICHSTFCHNGRYGSFCPKLQASTMTTKVINHSSFIENYVFLVGYLLMFIIILVLMYYVNYKADTKDINDYIMRTSKIVGSFFSKIGRNTPTSKDVAI